MRKYRKYYFNKFIGGNFHKMILRQRKNALTVNMLCNHDKKRVVYENHPFYMKYATD